MCIKRYYEGFVDFVEEACFDTSCLRYWGFIDVLIWVRISALLMTVAAPIGPILLWPIIPTALTVICSTSLISSCLVFLSVKFRRFDLLLPYFVVMICGPIFTIVVLSNLAYHLLQGNKRINPGEPTAQERFYGVMFMALMMYFPWSVMITRRAIGVFLLERREKRLTAADVARMGQTVQWLYAAQQPRLPVNLNRLATAEIEQVQVEPAEHCAICLEDWISEEIVTKLKCGHIFHDGCIGKTLLSMSTCPYCRRRIDDTTICKIDMSEN